MSGNPTKQSGHKHAALMAEYAKDAAETDKPWERWEYRGESDKWQPLAYNNPSWNPSLEYRRKPQPLELWVNIYPNGEYGAPRNTEAEAKSVGSLAVRTIRMREVTNE